MSNIIITIGRQFGSGGREIGEKLASSLQIGYYDKKLIELSAKKSGLAQSLLQDQDEKVTGSLLYSIVTGNMVGGSLATVNSVPISDRLYTAQSELIEEVSKTESCVIIGRCADYVLRDNPDIRLLSVFIHAPLDQRIKRGVEKYGIEPDNAKKTLERTDKKRAHYYSYYSDRKWGDVTNYDLSLNSGLFGIDGCVEVLADVVNQMKSGVL